MSGQTVAENRKARFDYFLFDKYEAGIALKGSEVKSIREGGANLQDSYIRLNAGEAFVVNLHVSPYRFAHDFLPEPTRSRKLLLKKREIEKMSVELARKGFVCVPLRIYFKRGFAKLEIALAKRKKAYDKRASLKEKIHAREIDKAVKDSRGYNKKSRG